MLHRHLFGILGIFFALVGFIGIFVPLLPTTPFVLLAAFFFERGSPYFHQKLVENKYLGPPLLDWQRHKRIRRKSKLIAISLILVGSYFPLSNPNIPWQGKIALALLLSSVATFIATRKES